MKTTIVSQKAMRYTTCGDYRVLQGIVNIMVYEQDNEDYNFLIAIHELIEEYLTRKHGIKEEDITEFDILYENNRTEGDSEPGDAPNCIYKKEHRFAENIERLVCAELGLDWNEYNRDLKIYHANKAI